MKRDAALSNMHTKMHPLAAAGRTHDALGHAAVMRGGAFADPPVDWKDQPRVVFCTASPMIL
jgi:hypothetical protein